jgi:HSP20 family protein
MIGWRFYEPSPLREALEQLLQLQESRGRWRDVQRGDPMPINVYDDGAELVIEALLPGVRPEDVELGCTDSLLTIEAELAVPEREYQHQEIRPTRFHRQLMLPPDCRFDQASATSEGGVLTVRIPKARPTHPERIRIEVARKPNSGPAIEARPGEDYKEVKKPRRPKP